MKVNLFFLVVGVSWLSKSLVKGTKGARLYKKRLLETTSENTSGSAKGISSAKKGNYNYGSSDFEYVATLSSKVSKKSSNKETSEDGSGSGGGKRSSKKSKGSSDVSIDNDESTSQPTSITLSENEMRFELESFLLFYIPSGRSIRMPLALENQQLLDATGTYIDWFFKQEYPSSVRTNILLVDTKYEGDNAFVSNQPVKKSFTSTVIFGDSIDLPTKNELQSTLEMAFDEQNKEVYQGWLNGPYPPTESIAELTSSNIFKGASVFTSQPSVASTVESTIHTTGIMIAAAAVGFTLLVAAAAIYKSGSGRDKVGHFSGLDKKQEEGTIAGETQLTSQTSQISPLTHQKGFRDEEVGEAHLPEEKDNDSLFLPALEENTSAGENQIEKAPYPSQDVDALSLDDDSGAGDWNDSNDYGDRQALADWRRQREDDESVDSLDDTTLSDDSTSSEFHDSQRPKSVVELTAMLSAKLPGTDGGDGALTPNSLANAGRPKTVKEIQMILSSEAVDE